LINLGAANRDKRDFSRAEQYYRQALDLARQARSGQLTAVSLLSLATLHDLLKDRRQSGPEAREALQFYQPNHYARETMQCLTLLMRSQRDSGDYDGALLSARSLLAGAEKVPDRAAMALQHESIATILFAQTRYPEALDEFQKSLDLAADAQHTGYASLGCGMAMWRLGRYADADAMFAKAAAVGEKFPSLRLQVISERAAMAVSQGRYQQAADLVKSAMAGTPPEPDVQSDLALTLGMSLLRGGNVRAGLVKCEEAWTAYSSGSDLSAKLQAALALFEARIESNRYSALPLLHEIEPAIAGFPELAWQFSALAARLDASYIPRARDALLTISHLWGESVYTTDLTRPDVGKLSRPLLRPVSGSH
jgi:tetratricopeptide (TPR) repeat protein